MPSLDYIPSDILKKYRLIINKNHLNDLSSKIDDHNAKINVIWAVVALESKGLFNKTIYNKICCSPKLFAPAIEYLDEHLSEKRISAIEKSSSLQKLLGLLSNKTQISSEIFDQAHQCGEARWRIIQEPSVHNALEVAILKKHKNDFSVQDFDRQVSKFTLSDSSTINTIKPNIKKQYYGNQFFKQNRANTESDVKNYSLDVTND